MQNLFLVDPTDSVSSQNLFETRFYLRRSAWDDYGFGTSFTVFAKTIAAETFIGDIKIGKKGQVSNGAYSETIFTQIDPAFDALSDDYFSVAQDASFYTNLIEALGQPEALRIAQALNDLATRAPVPDELIEEPVAQRSLLRYVSLRTVTDQYRPLILGLQERESFSLTYHPRITESSTQPVRFGVDPDSPLPSNLHVIIGANGMGKTTALKKIAAALDEQDPQHDSTAVTIGGAKKFAGLVSVSFSAFDIFPKTMRAVRSQAEFRVTRVGLPLRIEDDDDLDLLLAKHPQALPTALDEDDAEPDEAEQQRRYWNRLIKGCLEYRPERLLSAFRLLADADQVLDSLGISDPDELLAVDFPVLSSGHKIVLLALGSLVRHCEARTLVLIDEPESHLHPPLLGAFARALSDLMTETNSLAIIATHSPVVLQEVPRTCAQKVWSLEGQTLFSEPEIQTFGENLGILTEEVFGLELDKSGYHALLRKFAQNHASYDEAKAELGGQLGSEAKIVLRSMMMSKGVK